MRTVAVLARRVRRVAVTLPSRSPPPGSVLGGGPQMTESRSRDLVLPLDDLEQDAEVAINHLVDRGNQCLSIGKHEDAERNQNGGDALDNLGRRQRDLGGPLKARRDRGGGGAEVSLLGHGICPRGLDPIRVESPRPVSRGYAVCFAVRVLVGVPPAALMSRRVMSRWVSSTWPAKSNDFSTISAGVIWPLSRVAGISRTASKSFA